jgi:hypothetical protein
MPLNIYKYNIDITDININMANINTKNNDEKNDINENVIEIDKTENTNTVIDINKTDTNKIVIKIDKTENSDTEIDITKTDSINTNNIQNCEENEKKKIIDIYNKLILMHGIKPTTNELIVFEDDYYSMIIKFDKWYDRALEFAQWDPRDYRGFLQIIDNFKNNIYPSFRESSIEDNIFIQNMLFKLNMNGQKYIFSSLIIIIFNDKYNNENETLNFDIANIYNEYIASLTININLNITALYELIFDKLKYQYKIYKLEQLKLLYNNALINNLKISDVFHNRILQDLI